MQLRDSGQGAMVMTSGSSAHSVLRQLPEGSVIACSPYCATPVTLLNALAEVSDELKNPTLVAGLLFGDLAIYSAIRRGSLRFRTWHVGAPARALAREGLIDYVPLRAADVASKALARVDVALVRTTTPDARGFVSLGPSASYSRQMLDQARLRIAEIDPTLPRTMGDDVTYRLDAFDHIVDSDLPIAIYESAPPSEQCRRVARNVVSLIPDGATIQLGIGSVAEAVAEELVTTSTEGLQLVGMITDRMVPLVESGQINTGPTGVTAVELLGTSVLFDWAAENPRLQMSSSKVVHDPRWLAQHSKLISICSALEVDVSGQVVSEQIGDQLIAGVGGVADFFEGAGLAEAGMRIIALTSTSAKGASRVGTILRSGTPVTIPRHSVDVVVTENGVAHLSGLSLADRAVALSQVATGSFSKPMEVIA